MGLYHQHKRCERAGKCHRFPVFWVSYKLDGLTGLAGITVLQNPRILQTAGGNPLDIRACQEVWSSFLGPPAPMLCSQEHPCGSTGLFSSHVPLIFPRMDGEFSQDVSEGKSFPAPLRLMFLGMLAPILSFSRLTTPRPNHMRKPVWSCRHGQCLNWVSPSKILTIPSLLKVEGSMQPRGGDGTWIRHL